MTMTLSSPKDGTRPDMEIAAAAHLPSAILRQGATFGLTLNEGCCMNAMPKVPFGGNMARNK